jgi:outer membrane lipoprotein-sorting protein
VSHFPINCPKRWLASVVLAFIGPTANLGFGQSSPDIKTILESVANVYEGQRQYDVLGATTTEQYSATGKSVIKAKFRIAFQEPNKFRFEQESSVEIDGTPNGTAFGPMVIIGDGTDVWGVSPTVNQYTKFRPSDLPTIQAWVKAATSAVFAPPAMLGKELANSKFIREEFIPINGTNVACFVIKLISPARPESTTFWVEKTRFMIRRIRSELVPSADTPSLGLSTTSDFLVVNIGVAPAGGTFVFTPSPSAVEVDKFNP